MAHRFFLETLRQQLGIKSLEEQQTATFAASERFLTLEGDQAHHAIQVMRFKVDNELVLFDGHGLECLAKVTTLNKKSLTLSVLKTSTLTKQMARCIEIAVALPKGDRQKFLVEKLVELGVSRLIPLRTNRSVAVANEKVIERLKKQVIEACKQCQRNVLMEVGSEQSMQQLANACVSDLQTKRSELNNQPTHYLIADPYGGERIAEVSSAASPVGRFVVAVGPEGGFDAGEVNLAIDSGFQPLRIGQAILRVETACLAAAAILGIGSATNH